MMKNTYYPYARRNCGFTLLELVLALGVCAVIISAVGGVFYSAERLRDSSTRAVNDALPVWRALSVMKRDLQGVMVPSPDGILSGDFKAGDVTSPGLNQNVAIELYTTTGTLQPDKPWGDVQRVTYEVRPTTPGKTLFRSVTRNLLANFEPDPDEQSLMDNVESVDFDCYDGVQWRSAWDTTLSDTNLPVAVRVRIQLAGDFQNRQPITLVVPLDSQSITNQTSSTTGS